MSPNNSPNNISKHQPNVFWQKILNLWVPVTKRLDINREVLLSASPLKKYNRTTKKLNTHVKIRPYQYKNFFQFNGLIINRILNFKLWRYKLQTLTSITALIRLAYKTKIYTIKFYRHKTCVNKYNPFNKILVLL